MFHTFQLNIEVSNVKSTCIFIKYPHQIAVDRNIKRIVFCIKRIYIVAI